MTSLYRGSLNYDMKGRRGSRINTDRFSKRAPKAQASAGVRGGGEVRGYATRFLGFWVIQIGSLSSDVFERRTPTGSKRFSLLICHDATKFVLLSVFAVLETIAQRFVQNHGSTMQKNNFRLKSVAQKRCCLSSLLDYLVSQFQLGQPFCIKNLLHLL